MARKRAKREPEEPRKPGVVTLGGREIKLQVPRSYAIRVEIVGYAAVNATRGMCAALGVCLPHLRQPDVTYDACSYSPAVYGGRVLDELVEQYSVEEVLDAAAEAYRLLREGLVTAREIKEAEGNSDAPDPSTD